MHCTALLSLFCNLTYCTNRTNVSFGLCIIETSVWSSPSPKWIWKILHGMFCNVGFFHFCSSKFMVILWSLWSSWRLLSYFHDWTQPHFCFKCWSLEITIALTVESVARFVELFIGYNIVFFWVCFAMWDFTITFFHVLLSISWNGLVVVHCCNEFALRFLHLKAEILF